MQVTYITVAFNLQKNITIAFIYTSAMEILFISFWYVNERTYKARCVLITI